jgi:hypothetical protein
MRDADAREHGGGILGGVGYEGHGRFPCYGDPERLRREQAARRASLFLGAVLRVNPSGGSGSPAAAERRPRKAPLADLFRFSARTAGSGQKEALHGMPDSAAGTFSSLTDKDGIAGFARGDPGAAGAKRPSGAHS